MASKIQERLWEESVRNPRGSFPRNSRIVYFRLTVGSPTNIAIRDMLLARQNISLPMAAKEALLEYALLLRDAIQDLDFTFDEAVAIVFALRNATLDRSTYHLIHAEVENYLEDHPELNVDRRGLVKLLRNLDFLHTAAVVDAARRYWIRTIQDLPLEEYLVEMGLVKSEKVPT